MARGPQDVRRAGGLRMRARIPGGASGCAFQLYLWPFSCGGAESTDEVVFESLDGSFCGVDAMIAGFDELDCTVAGVDEFFDGGRGLIVCDIEGGSKPFYRESVEDGAEGCNDVFTLC